VKKSHTICQPLAKGSAKEKAAVTVAETKKAAVDKAGKIFYPRDQL